MGNWLTGGKTAGEKETERLDALDRKTEQVFGTTAGVDVSTFDGQSFHRADGSVITDADYDSVYGAGSAETARAGARTAWEKNTGNGVPTGAENVALQQGQDILAAETPAAPAVPKTPEVRLAEAAGYLAPFQGTGAVTTGAPRASGTGAAGRASQFTGGVDAVAAAPTQAVAPTVDTKAIKKTLGGLDTYQNAIWQLSQDNTGLSAAEAQLKKATELANIQAGINTEASQRAALGQARSARNRGDRALLERQAVGEAGYIGQDAARTASLRQAEAEGNIAVLRANETEADRQFKLQAIKEAADLGLNTAALQLDISKANLDSANNWINNEFARENLGLQLDQQKTEALLGFTRDMAALQFQYDQMSVQDQQATDALVMQKYGIDQQTMVALKQIKASKQFDWNQLLTTVVGGIGSGATAAIAASDERVKTNVQPVEATAKEFDEFMSAMSANTYEYKEPDKFGDGLRFGFMAQDLEKTKLGHHMVRPIDGVKMVQIAPLALATASGLALVHERLKELEKAVR